MNIRKQTLKALMLTALLTTALPVQAFFDTRSLWGGFKKSSIAQLAVGDSILGLGIYTAYRLYNVKTLKKSALDANPILDVNSMQSTKIVPLVVEDQIKFDRESMSLLQGQESYKVEGYWATSSNPKDDRCNGRYPFPKKNEKPWVGKESFLKKLESMEKSAVYEDQVNAMGEGKRLRITIMKGPALSRLDKSWVGNEEFSDIDNRISWPQGYGKHYIGKYNVVPSREFYRYVMNYRLS